VSSTAFDKSVTPGASTKRPAHKTLHEVRRKVGKNVFVYGNPAWLFDMLEAWRELSGAPEPEAAPEALRSAVAFLADVMGCRQRGRETEALQADMRAAKLVREEPFPNLVAHLGHGGNRAGLHTPLHRTELDTGDLLGGILGANSTKRLECEGGDLSPRTERWLGPSRSGPSFK
jgi:hypothetical protein